MSDDDDDFEYLKNPPTRELIALRVENEKLSRHRDSFLDERDQARGQRDVAREIAQWAWRHVPDDKKGELRQSAQRSGVWATWLEPGDD